MKRSILALAALVIVAALAVAGCGGSSGSSSSSSAGYGNEESSGGGAYGSSGGGGYGSSESASNASTGGGAAAISVANASGVGKVLVDSKGLTLYYFEKDKKGSGESTCNGACANAWPPVTTSGAPQAGEGAQSAKLGTIKRSDGTTQVTYAGWPLYTFASDKKPGEAGGTDVKAFGASWYPLQASGEKAGD